MNNKKAVQIRNLSVADVLGGGGVLRVALRGFDGVRGALAKGEGEPFLVKDFREVCRAPRRTGARGSKGIVHLLLRADGHEEVLRWAQEEHECRWTDMIN